MGADSSGDGSDVAYSDLLEIRPALRDVHDALRDHAPEPLTTQEVADAVDCKRRTAYNRLTKLIEAGGPVTNKGIGKGRGDTPHVRVWWYTEVTVTENDD